MVYNQETFLNGSLRFIVKVSFVIAISQEWKLLALQATQSRHPISTVDVNKCVRSMCCGRKKCLSMRTVSVKIF